MKNANQFIVGEENVFFLFNGQQKSCANYYLDRQTFGNVQLF